MVNRSLTGNYTRVIDEKLRIAIPKPLRRQLSQEEDLSLFVAPGTERSLFLFSPASFHDLGDRLAQRGSNRADSRNYLRLFYSQAEEVTLDVQSRIRIPERLVNHAGLKHDVVLVGVHDHAEIWDKGLWEEFLAAHTSQFDEMASHAFDCCEPPRAFEFLPFSFARRQTKPVPTVSVEATDVGKQSRCRPFRSKRPTSANKAGADRFGRSDRRRQTLSNRLDPLAYRALRIRREWMLAR